MKTQYTVDNLSALSVNGRDGLRKLGQTLAGMGVLTQEHTGDTAKSVSVWCRDARKGDVVAAIILAVESVDRPDLLPPVPTLPVPDEQTKKQAARDAFEETLKDNPLLPQTKDEPMTDEPTKTVSDDGPEPTPEPMPEPTPEPMPDATGREKAIADLIGILAEPPVNRAEIADIVTATIREKLAEIAPVRIQVDTPTFSFRTTRQHYLFELILTVLSCDVPVWLVGPAGSGKSHVGMACARALFGDDDHFYPKSCGPEMAEYSLLGYNAAGGEYIPGIIREPFENGGLTMLDEIERSNPAVLTVLNSALANGHCSFPDKVARRSEKWRVIAAGNTWGLGADAQYTSATRIDAATIDRFAFIEMPYDEGLEASIIGTNTVKSPKGPKIERDNNGKAVPTCDLAYWADRVRRIRAAVTKTGVQLIVSPRATINGAKLTQAGIPVATVEKMLIWRGVDAPTKAKIESAM